MKTLKVTTPPQSESSYTIYISANIISKIIDMVNESYPQRAKFIVTDSNLVQAGHLQSLDPDGLCERYIINPPGEESKNIDTVTRIIETMEELKFGRDSLIIALGGGTVGDIAGFAAAVYKRAIPVVHVPTTTVSQADSSIGGKTGVDSALSKNAYGAFHQPAAVYIDTATLTTLDDKQYRSGLVESVKHALIADREYFDYLALKMPAILDRDIETLKQIAIYNCQIKASVVRQDPYEKNMRRILNYGHTIGHAVETASGYNLNHGESVALGIRAANIIEQKLGLIDNERARAISGLLSGLGMSLKIPASISKEVLIENLARDKKAVQGVPKFVLLEDIGRARCVNSQWAHDVDPAIVSETVGMLY